MKLDVMRDTSQSHGNIKLKLYRKHNLENEHHLEEHHFPTGFYATFFFITAAVFVTDCIAMLLRALSIIDTVSASDTILHYTLMSDHMQSSRWAIYKQAYSMHFSNVFAESYSGNQIIWLSVTCDMRCSTSFQTLRLYVLLRIRLLSSVQLISF